jgi:hypothetical protein
MLQQGSRSRAQGTGQGVSALYNALALAPLACTTRMAAPAGRWRGTARWQQLLRAQIITCTVAARRSRVTRVHAQHIEHIPACAAAQKPV